MVKTYVLAGHDWNGAFKDQMGQWEDRARQKGDVVILRPKPGQSMVDLAVLIKPPANVILEAHGTINCRFEWNKGESHYYRDLFKVLPREGIQSITIDGCYGGSALAMLGDVPKGTVLQSRVGSQVEGLGGHIGGRFAAELSSYNDITPLTIMLEALDNTDPFVYKRLTDEYNAFIIKYPKKAKELGLSAADNINPNDVLPHTIGIGGNPPATLDLNQKMAELSTSGKAHRLNQAQFRQAIAQVKQHFDPNNGEILINGNLVTGWIGDKTGFYFGRKDKLDARIDEVAKKIESGADTSKFKLEEKRIGYALTVANLYSTGEVQRMVAQGKHVEPPPRTMPVETARPNIPNQNRDSVTPVVIEPKQNPVVKPPETRRVDVKWNGLGDEATAKLQAIAETVFHLATDRGGVVAYVDGANRTVSEIISDDKFEAADIKIIMQYIKDNPQSFNGMQLLTLDGNGNDLTTADLQSALTKIGAKKPGEALRS